MIRRLCWVSAGAASAVATKLDIATHPDADRLLVYVDPGSEHSDNARFISDLEQWYRLPIIVARSDRYRNTWDVWESTGYLNGPSGARCTAELKKRPRYAIQRPDDVQIYGYTVEEQHRADRFREQNPDITVEFPLIDRQLTKADCLAIIERAGITLPAMYLLGYANNNCVGCPKGGIGYWNKIRRDFPDVFDRMAALERQLGHTCTRDDDGPVWLDLLDPERGRMDEPDFECSLFCHAAEAEVQP